MKKRNRKSFGRVVSWQRTYEINVGKSYCGEASPYWEWYNRNIKPNSEDEKQEYPQANPDVLPDNTDYEERRSDLQDLIENTVETLSPRELQVFCGLKNGFTEDQIAKQINVSRSMVEKCRRNIKNKFTKQGIKSA
jgi:DNA-binding CsgD family transcriptional regulator